jgi:hypothetical protein
MDYDIEVYEQPGLELPVADKRALQEELCALASKYLSPLPRYQVFDTACSTALDDKIVVTARKDGKLVGFVSAVILPIQGLSDPAIHTGVTIIHEDHRRSPVKRLLFSTLFIRLLSNYPTGIWLTILAEVITSLVHIARYTTKVFPSLEWAETHPENKPSAVHLQIAKDISKNHRPKMLISPDATLDEERFVFLGGNDHAAGRVFMKDVDDKMYWHLDEKMNQFYRRFFRRNKGDEVLQVAFLDFENLVAAAEREGRQEFVERASKVRRF